jgi:hypothetical protein
VDDSDARAFDALLILVKEVRARSSFFLSVRAAECSLGGG